KLSAPAALSVALWSAEKVAPLARPDQRKEIQRILALVRDVLRAPPKRPVQASSDPRFRALGEQLREAAATQRKDSRALGAARRAAGGAASICVGKPDMVWPNAALAAERVVQAQNERDDHEGVRAYLTALDDR